MNSKCKKEFKEEAIKLSDNVGVKTAAEQLFFNAKFYAKIDGIIN